MVIKSEKRQNQQKGNTGSVNLDHYTAAKTLNTPNCHVYKHHNPLRAELNIVEIRIVLS